MEQSIFRKKTLDTLSSPEQLDRVMTVTRPMGWMALAGCFILIAIAFLWGIKGNIHTTVQGQGILLREGAIYDVVSLGTGQVKKIMVSVDDAVTKGQVIATLSLPGQDQQLRQEREQLANLESEKKMILTLGDKTTLLKRKTLANQRKTIEKAIAGARDNLAYIEKELASQQAYYKKKLTTRSVIQDVKNRYQKVLKEIMDYQSQLNDISAKEMDLSATIRKERFAIEHKISQVQLKIREIQATRDLESRVVSTRTGRVLEIYTNSGKVIHTGEPLISVEVEGESHECLSAFLYFSPGEGKKVREGMSARISPSNVKTEEYGYMIGKIRQVSRFPASQKGMLRVLQNQDLVNRLFAGGAPISVTAGLLADGATAGRYKWSSGSGPDTTIDSGTLCMADVVVSSQPPIELALPFLRKKLFGIGDAQVGFEEK
ncbi:NHLP bacteriocin system secretion protein [Desulfobacter vibrioformis]|uniref:NHLP bacteriocin system secretion protein n=1 Tax=Desulfobacter vibrioformis TaxID=34031 RepID=UPI0005511826|nr:NHLP bacteriocin system secretion protein [Desulfobacter vibrioformis]